MKRSILAAAALVAVVALPTAGTAKNHDEPGTPGEANCHGQTIAYLNEAAGDLDIHGIGNLAKASGFSVQEVQAIVDEFCNPPEEP